jgi:hypothetical protein
MATRALVCKRAKSFTRLSFFKDTSMGRSEILIVQEGVCPIFAMLVEKVVWNMLLVTAITCSGTNGEPFTSPQKGKRSAVNGAAALAPAAGPRTPALVASDRAAGKQRRSIHREVNNSVPYAAASS